MEPTYSVIGSDGKQYGPITTDQIRGWIQEGRIVSETKVWRSDMPDWVAASNLPELGLQTPVAATLPASMNPIATHVPVGGVGNPELERRVRSGATWFYWIAAFSVVNSVLTATGSSWGFALGMGATAILDHIGAGAGGGAQVVTLAVSAIAIGVLALFGFFSCKGHAWAFIVGMIVLAADTVLVGVLQMWISLIIHAFALFSIFGAFKASRAMRQV